MSEVVILPMADYQRLLQAAEGDEMLIWCEVCGAWLDRSEPNAATTDDFHGCWYAATQRPQDVTTCVKDRRPSRAWVTSEGQARERD